MSYLFLRVEKFVIGYHSFWKFVSCEVFGAIVCLSAVLSVFILTLLLQGSVCDGCSVDHDEELMKQVPDRVITEGRTFDTRI